LGKYAEIDQINHVVFQDYFLGFGFVFGLHLGIFIGMGGNITVFLLFFLHGKIRIVNIFQVFLEGYVFVNRHDFVGRNVERIWGIDYLEVVENVVNPVENFSPNLGIVSVFEEFVVVFFDRVVVFRVYDVTVNRKTAIYQERLDEINVVMVDFGG